MDMDSEMDLFDLWAANGPAEFLFHQVWDWITGHGSRGRPARGAA